MRVYSLAHTSISVPPDDPHYGLDGRYSICLHYGEDSADFQTCRNDSSQTVYAERNLGGLVHNFFRHRNFRKQFCMRRDVFLPEYHVRFASDIISTKH